MVGMKTEYTISWVALFRIVTVVSAVFLLWKLTNVILMIAVALMLASAFHPIVLKLQKWMPVSIASILVITFLVLPIFLIGFSFFPNLISQFPDILIALDRVLRQTAFLPEPLRNID